MFTSGLTRSTASFYSSRRGGAHVSFCFCGLISVSDNFGVQFCLLLCAACVCVCVSYHATQIEISRLRNCARVSVDSSNSSLGMIDGTSLSESSGCVNVSW